MPQIRVMLRACSLLQAVYGHTTRRRLCGTMSTPGSAHGRWIVSGIVTAMSPDLRRAVTADTVYEIADYAPALGSWGRDLVAWHLWRRNASVPDRVEWLQPDGSIHDIWMRPQVVASIRASFDERQRIRRAIEDALDGDGRELG